MTAGYALCVVVGRGNGHLGALGKGGALVCNTKIGREQVATVLLLKKKTPKNTTHKNQQQKNKQKLGKKTTPNLLAYKESNI